MKNYMGQNKGFLIEKGWKQIEQSLALPQNNLVYGGFYGEEEQSYALMGVEGTVVYQGNIDNNIEQTIEKDLGSYPYFILIQIATGYGGAILVDFYEDLRKNGKITLLREHLKLAFEDFVKYSNLNPIEEERLEMSLSLYNKCLDLYV